MFKKVIYNTGAQAIAKAISATTTLLVTLIIGRALGPSGYGDFTKIFVFVGYFYTFADFGLNNIYVREAEKNNAATLFRTLIGLRIVLSFLLASIAILIALILPYNQMQSTGFSPIVKAGIIIASLTIITQALFTTTNAYFQKKLRYDYSLVGIAIGSVLILAVLFLFSLSQKNLLPFVWVFILGGTAYFTSSLIIISKKFKQSISPIFNLEKSKKMLQLSWPIGIALIFNLVYFRIDVIILSGSRSSTEVGIYGLAYQFFQASLAIPIFFANALYPILADYYKSNIKFFRRQIKIWLALLFAFSLLLVLILFTVSLFIPFIFGTGFASSQNSLQILSLGMPLFFISALLWHLLIIYEKQKFLIPIYLIGAIFNISLNLVFIPQYGYIAASAITGISEALVLIMSALALKIPIQKGDKQI